MLEAYTDRHRDRQIHETLSGRHRLRPIQQTDWRQQKTQGERVENLSLASHLVK